LVNYSGAMYSSVPARSLTKLLPGPCWEISAEIPKSIILTEVQTVKSSVFYDELLCVKIIFSGFKSLCTTFFEWINSTP